MTTLPIPIAISLFAALSVPAPGQDATPAPHLEALPPVIPWDGASRARVVEHPQREEGARRHAELRRDGRLARTARYRGTAAGDDLDRAESRRAGGLDGDRLRRAGVHSRGAARHW